MLYSQRTRLALSLLTALLLPLTANAQIEHGGQPVSMTLSLPGSVETVELQPTDLRALQIEDSARGVGEPMRFGEAIQVDLSLYDGGQWQILPDGRRVWRARIESPGAYSLSVIFSRFQLPPEGELFVYNDDRSVVRGAYTYMNHNANGAFAIQPIPGDALTLEYIEPNDSPNPGTLALQSVIHDYTDVLGQLAAGACNIDVACAPAFEDQSRATVKTFIGPFLCSGFLLNNTAEDGTQLFLTSEHCGSQNGAIFQFGFQRPTCGSGTAPTNLTVQGGVTLVTDAANDFQLVRIVPQIPDSYEPFLSGWDNSGNVPATTYAVHHPSGDEKAVCMDLDSPVMFGGIRWRVLNWDQGTTEVGSSGCGLFDDNGRAIGCLEGGFADCNDPSDDRFIRMDVMWPQLAPFLDPLGTGAATLDGYDPLAQPPQPLTAVSTQPAGIPILQPGLSRDVRIIGTGFSSSTFVGVNGVPLSSGDYAWINTQTLELDFPQQTAVGPATINLLDGTQLVDLTVQVVPVSTPKLQIGNGEPGNPVQFSVPFLIAGQPGDLLYVTFSRSMVPSVHPAWTLEYGNQFTEVEFLGMYMIPASGLVELSSPTTGIFLTRFWSTSTLLNGVFPAVQSNLQEILVVL